MDRLPARVVPQDPNSPCHCIHCNGLLPVKIAKTGNFPGHPYIHCHTCSWHHTFPKNTIVVMPAHSSQSTQPTAIPSIRCSNTCKRQGHRACGRRMCKQCCVTNGGCTLRDHHASRLTRRQQEKLSGRHISAMPSPPPLSAPPQPSRMTTPSMSRTPPPLDPSISFRSLELFLAADPTVMLLQQEQEKAEVESMHEQREDQLAVQEEADYQQAVSNSLGLSYIVPASPAPLAPSASGSGLHGALPTVIPTVRTVPYCPPKITQHLNDNWMRPTQDNTPKARKVVRKPNLDNRFTIIFWGKNDSPPTFRAVHECSEWPKWVLLDAPDVQEDLGVKIEPLQFYEMRNRQWITCTPSYPHDVKKDGYLLLRRTSVTYCHDFESHSHQANLKPPHFRDNMAYERASVRTMLAQRRQSQHLDIIQESDIEAEKARRQQKALATSQKRQRVEEDEEWSSQKRLHVDSNDKESHSPNFSTPHRKNPPAFLSATDRSPSIEVSSPCPCSPVQISEPSTSDDVKLPYVPSSCSRWPEHMYAVDMKDGFALVDSLVMKKKHKKLMDRVAAVFQRPIPETTYYDQRRRWQRASEKQRQNFATAGHMQAGLWCNFPK